MKKTLLAVLMILGMVTLAEAAPSLVCDPQAGITHYKLTGPVWVPASAPAQPDGSIKLDVSTALVGSNSMTVAACKTDPVWGELCSSTVPFVFSRPGAPSTPENAKLSP